MSRSRINIRLRDYDYSSDGIYYITICTLERRCQLGTVDNGKVILSEPGETAERYWNEIPFHFPDISLDKHIIMPNHIHGILIINHKNKLQDLKGCGFPVGTCHGMSLHSVPDDSVGPRHGVALHDDGPIIKTRIKNVNQFGKPYPGSISVAINQFKAAVRKWCINNDHTSFSWQSRFYDHIVTDINEYNAIREYIELNPLNWVTDDLNIRHI